MQPTNVNIDPNMPDNVRRETPRGFVPASSQQVMTSDHDNVLDEPQPAPQPQRPAVPDVRRGATSASNAEADGLCLGRHNAQRGLPDEPTDDADMGTRIHAALAGELSVEDLQFEERELHDNCKIIEARLVAQFFPNVPVEKLKVFRHRRAWVRVPPGMWEHSGELDVLYRYGTRGLIIDYKTLPGDKADPPQNQQLRDLAVLNSGSLLLDELGVAIDQPLVTWAPEICVYNKAALKRAEAEMFERVRQSNRPDAPRTPGEVQCKFCKAARLSRCPEHKTWLAPALPAALDLRAPFEKWTETEFVAFLKLEPAASDWLENGKKAAKAFMEAGNRIAGFALGGQKTYTNVTDIQEVFNRWTALGGNMKQFMAALSVQNGKLKEQLSEVTGARGQKLEKALTALLADCISTKKSALSIVKGKKALKATKK